MRCNSGSRSPARKFGRSRRRCSLRRQLVPVFRPTPLGQQSDQPAGWRVPYAGVSHARQARPDALRRDLSRTDRGDARQHRRQGRALRGRPPQADNRLTEDGPPVHSLQSLLADLATYARIQATTALNEKYLFTLSTRPTIVQQRALRTPRRQPGSYPVTLPALSANSREIKPLSMPKECAELQLPLPAPPSRTRRPRPD
jgi:hypothetical protein